MAKDSHLRKLWRKFRRFERRNPSVQILLLILVMWIVGAILLQIFEGVLGGNEEFQGFGNTWYSIAIYLLSGLDSGEPTTPAGKVIAVIVLFGSLVLVAAFTGGIASHFVERRVRRRAKMPDHELKNHIVICNWNDKGIPIIEEVHADIVREKRPVVIISDDVDAANLPDKEDLPQFEDVYLVKGDPANEVILKRANVHRAYTVLILADPHEKDLADAKSILISMAIRSVCQAEGLEKVWVCVEGASPMNAKHLERAGAEEIIAPANFAMMLLSQSALSHGLSQVYRNLLTVSGETNEVYILPVPDELVGKTFVEVGVLMFENRNRENPVIPIGIRSERKTVVNPRDGNDVKLEKGDKLVVIAFEEPDSLV